MFKQVGVAVGLVCVSLAAGCATSGRDYEPIQYEQARQGVTVSQDDAGGVEVVAQVDMADLASKDAVRDAAWYAKPFVAAKEVTVGTVNYVRENKIKSVLGVAVGYVTVRAVQGKLGDDIKRLTGEGTTGGGNSSSDSELDGQIDASVSVPGDNNTVNQTINITYTPPPVFVTSQD